MLGALEETGDDEPCLWAMKSRTLASATQRSIQSVMLLISVPLCSCICQDMYCCAWPVMEFQM
jgi:hypothetical protein